MVAALLTASATSAQLRHPNVVLITIDTTRADALGVYGQPRPTTPAIDGLADRGVVFEQAITTNPETLPAHASLFTGMFPFSHGVRDNLGQQLAAENLTLAEILREPRSNAVALLSGHGVTRLDVLNFISHGIRKGPALHPGSIIADSCPSP